MPYTATISISVLPDRLYKITGPAGVDAYYSNKKVLGAGANPYFIANDTTSLIVESAGALSGNVQVVELLRSYYDAYDGQGGTWAYQQGIDRWVTHFSFRPEWISQVGNRLVTFKAGKPYVHNSATTNRFYGVDYDSVIAFSHSEAGNFTKVYNAMSVEGDTPDLVHVRTEKPNVQSSDLRSADFAINEGVRYGAILRDRLSPNTSGSYEDKLVRGDKVRGEVALFQAVFTQPLVSKVLKFFNISFTLSRGHSNTPQNSE